MSPPDRPASPSLLTEPLSNKLQGVNLFLVGFLVLFLELACIRWFAAYVIFLQFFTNVVLISSFLGMSCGLLTAGQRQNWLARFPFLALGTVLAALFIRVVYHYWAGLVVDVGHQASPQLVFFGTEYRNPDVASFVLPIELIAALFFVLIALLFVGLGQVLGRAFDAYPNRILGYTLNIGGSLAGIAGFSALSFVQSPPLVWFLITVAGIGYLLYQRGWLTPVRAIALGCVLIVVALPVSLLRKDTKTRWSPYYAIFHDKTQSSISVNTIGHQTMVPFAAGGSSYSLIHLLRRHTEGKPFEDVMIIGAGSGNDVAHALRFGVSRIDAVEIDPVIQDIGARYHPDRPYQDSRVVVWLDDGRHFLRTTERKYDLVVYALVDSLILHSSYANIRLESYLFTEQAFADIRRVLKPGGIFVMYNFFRQGWIVRRAAAMAERAFGRPPIVIGLPYKPTLSSQDQTGLGFGMLIAGDNRAMADAFRQHGTFWMHTSPPQNLKMNGFSVALESSEPRTLQQIAPSRLPPEAETPLPTTDDWPFLYLRGKLIPTLSLRSTLLLGVLGVAMVYTFLPKPHGQIHSRMLFLGAGFMLLETKAVVQLALLFGSTWLVNALVFFTVLVLILLANLYVLKVPKARPGRHYVGLLVLLAANVLIALDTFLGGDVLLRYVAPCVLSLAPMFFASVIFAQSFRDASNPDHAFGSNIAGSVVGGLSESFSMLVGFRYSLLIAMLFYVLSMWAPPVRIGKSA